MLEVLGWIEDFVGLIKAEEKKLLGVGRLVACSLHELGYDLLLEVFKIIQGRQLQILLVEEFHASPVALSGQTVTGPILACSLIHELSLKDPLKGLLDRDAEVVWVLALLVEVVCERLAPVALAQKRR